VVIIIIKIRVVIVIYLTWQHYCKNAVWTRKFHFARRTNRFYEMPRKEKIITYGTMEKCED